MIYQNKKISILNLDLCSFSKEDLRQYLKSKLSSNKKIFVAKVNSEFLLRGLKDDQFQKTLKSADLLIADGVGVLWAARFLTLPLSNLPILRQIQAVWQTIYSGVSLLFYPKFCSYPISERIPGLDCMYLMLEIAEDQRSSVYFFGAEKEVLEKATQKIIEKYPNLRIAGRREGYNYKNDELVKKINKSGAKLLIVALGSPKQEFWIKDHLGEFRGIKIAVGEGGTLDRAAGVFKPAPKLFCKMGLEWLWRLFFDQSKTETGTRFRRIWQAVPVFIFYVVKFKLKYGQTKI